MNKKCNFCDETTKQNRGDLHEIHWAAFKIGKEKTVYACPKHNDDLRKLIYDALGRKDA